MSDPTTTDPPDIDASATLMAELDAARAALQSFVEAYANAGGRSNDMMQVDLFHAWLRACDVLGIKLARGGSAAASAARATGGNE